VTAPAQTTAALWHVCLEEVALIGQDDRLRPVAEVELHQEPGDVGLTVVSLMNSSRPISVSLPVSSAEHADGAVGHERHVAAGPSRLLRAAAAGLSRQTVVEAIVTEPRAKSCAA
jgi:hypothetical protein